ncbi:LppM family (lipo)protein [Rhodococcus sp. NPDC056743]|uniref:LppM family (lipo)protein n=1 Tax=Rhodococcus sp. NPDC056743 TaxID=3345934 RepID=UPI00366F4B89
MTTVQQSTDDTTRPRRRKQLLATTALALMLVPLLAGCLRVQVSMGVSADDRVSGQIVAAVIPENEADPGPQLVPPTSLAENIRVQEYKKDGYVGSQVFFWDLSFGDVSQLAAMTDEGAGSFQLTLQRSGDTVALDGKADLKSLPAQGSDIQFSIAFPARISTTNGNRDGDSRVSWTLPAGEVSTVRAEVNYADPSTRSFAGWAGIMAGLTLGVAIIVGAMAWMVRNRAPVSPAPTSPQPTKADTHSP